MLYFRAFAFEVAKNANMTPTNVWTKNSLRIQKPWIFVLIYPGQGFLIHQIKAFDKRPGKRSQNRKKLYPICYFQIIFYIKMPVLRIRDMFGTDPEPDPRIRTCD
jgi:hypothetical protein